MMLFEILVELACVAAIVLASPFRQGRQTEQNSCENPDCYSYATKLATGIDWSTNPCDDFFQFACGRWIKKATFPERMIVMDNLFIQQRQLYGRVEEILSSPVSKNETALQKAQLMYQSCVYAESYLENNLNYIRSIISSLGGWKLGTSEPVQINDVVKLLVLLSAETDNLVPFSVQVRTSTVDNRIKFIVLFQPEEKYLLKTTYPSLTANDLVILGNEIFGSEVSRQAMQEAANVVNMDKNFFLKLMDPQSASVSGTLKEVQKSLPTINLANVLNTVFAGIDTITDEDLVYVSGVRFFQNLFANLNNPVNARAVYNYAIAYETIKLLRLVGDVLPSPLREISSFRLYSGGSRFDDCSRYVSSCFDMAIARKYGELYHDIQKEVELIKGLTDDIMDEFSERLKVLDWLDDQSRAEAEKKLANIKGHYEYPRWGVDLNTVNDFYKNIQSTGTLTGDQYQCTRLSKRLDLEEYHKDPSDHFKWGESPLTVNAYYQPTKNDIHILEAILEDPVYNPNRLNLMNYAGLGYILGHEITHGFDNNGVQFDEVGNQRNWLSEDSQKKFSERTQCLIDQYSNFKLTPNDLPGPTKEYTVNGSLTLPENIADHGGLTLSYYAYQHWLENHEPEVIPDILKKNFTEEQSFFLAFARTWCVKYEYGITAQALTDVHSPDKFRINGPLANFKKFSEAFNCPADSPMNRGDKSCLIW